MITSIQALLGTLNPQQLQAATQIHGPVLVLAGAGSGKTKTLTVRIANMILEHGISPESLFVATFTNKAANEMKERIAHACGEAAAKTIWSGTFHSLCSRLLRKYAHHLGYDQSFSIYDQEDAEKLIYRIYEMMRIEKDYHVKIAYQYISNCKNKMWSPDHAADVAELPSDQVMSLVYRHYETILKSANAMDFDDLIIKTIQLLKHHHEPRQWIQHRFQYVMVDEYQDINDAQFELIRLIAFPQNHVFVVGDDWQSIYAFRGSDMRHILQFERQFPQVTTVYLTQNYRSTQTIVRAGNQIITHNKHQKQKQLSTQNSIGQTIALIEAEDEYKEAAFIGWMINQKVQKEQAKYSDFAILYRTNHQSAPFEKLFLHGMIPYQIIGGISFFQREEIKDVIAYLRIIKNPKDDAAMLRVLNKPARGIGKTSEEALIQFANEKKISIFRALHHVMDIPDVNKRTQLKIQSFLQLIAQLQTYQHPDLLNYVHHVLDQTGYRAMWEARNTSEATEKLEHLRELLATVEQYKLEYPEHTITELLADFSLMSNHEEQQEPGVRLMTMHSAKGLEFPYVFIVGMNEGIFPSWRSTTPLDIEEERRLAYVGITRAKNELYLTHSRTKTNYKGGMQTITPSRFLSELPADLIKTYQLPKS